MTERTAHDAVREAAEAVQRMLLDDADSPRAGDELQARQCFTHLSAQPMVDAPDGRRFGATVELLEQEQNSCRRSSLSSRFHRLARAATRGGSDCCRRTLERAWSIAGCGDCGCGLCAYFGGLARAVSWQFVCATFVVSGLSKGVGEEMIKFAAQYLYTDAPPDGFGFSSARVAAVAGLVPLPWVIKALYGILSDTVAAPASGGARRNVHRTHTWS